ncbi:hypothetical protein BDZ89DRAFT_1065633 [Hymenopellis radicata]|nr:hypothetical protein BDZ89DRAFT_1065633 [Hymenopellis radicata]
MSFPWVPSGPIISLSPASGSYPFQTKYIPLSSTKHVLGSVEGGGKTPRKASTGNGWFASKTDSAATPLTLSAVHAEVWMESGQVYLRDLDSAFGTYVNGAKVRSAVTLKTGDTLALGTKIDRNSRTPSNITDEQLLSITAKVTIVGITS